MKIPTIPLFRQSCAILICPIAVASIRLYTAQSERPPLSAGALIQARRAGTLSTTCTPANPGYFPDDQAIDPDGCIEEYEERPGADGDEAKEELRNPG